MVRDTKGKIIASAANVAVTRGVQNMTMDAVAEEAGISKGAVFYHFDSKHDLLLSMVQALTDVTDSTIADVQSKDTEPGSWLRGFLKASLTNTTEDLGPVGRLSVAFLTAAANDTSLLEPMNRRQPAWREAINQSGLDPVQAQIIRLAADGLWINDVMGVPVLDAAERTAVIERLQAMTREKAKPDQKGNQA
ncbi:MAG: TetR family transcriptional regulator [Rhizobiaceae bacterium]|nr:TetR family transcriptional regulator [Rhizobiaceae bacterium]